jgi:hypothetical protein
MRTTDEQVLERLGQLQRGSTLTGALGLVDSLAPVAVGEMTGAWRGSGLPTGHPFDGLLERFGWHGKRFEGPDGGHPLVFRGRGGSLFSLDPGRVPLRLVHLVAARPHLARLPFLPRLFRAVAPLLRTTSPRSRLRMVEYRGVVSAAMVYDALPALDAFRRVDPDTVVGAMDLRGVPQPFFFVLRREPGQHPGTVSGTVRAGQRAGSGSRGGRETYGRGT